MRWMLVAGLVGFCAQPVSAQLGDGLAGKKLARAIETASSQPFGSDKNPVRVRGPQGERAYLRRLRCTDGTAPAFERTGSTGIGPYRNILDLYSVTCAAGKATDIYLDMYHDHIEVAPVPGFTIVAP